MLKILQHVFQYAEAYAVLLVWIVIPLGYFVCFRFFQRRYGMFISNPAPLTGKGKLTDAQN